MKYVVLTRSGAQYIFDDVNMTWERRHETIDILGLPSQQGKNAGRLVEWPVLTIGRQIMFDDSEIGTIYTTPIVAYDEKR